MDNNSLFCSFCGKEVKNLRNQFEFKCDECEAGASEDAVFCYQCGERFEEDISEHEQQAVPEDSETLPDNYIGVFIVVDILAHAVAGYLIGFYTGYFFYGIAFKKHFWPGIIAIAVASYLGANRYV